MIDWVTIAKANGLDVSARELDRIADSLNALHATFKPLAAGLTPDEEPAFEFHMEEE